MAIPMAFQEGDPYEATIIFPCSPESIFTSIALLHLLRSFTAGIPLSKAGLYRLVNAGDKHQRKSA
jgi:hypothetical protein